MELGLFCLLVSRKITLILEQSLITADKTWKNAVIASISAHSSERGICERTSLASEIFAESTYAPKKTGKKSSEGSQCQQLSRKSKSSKTSLDVK